MGDPVDGWSGWQPGGMFAPPSPPQIVGGETAEAVVTGGLFSSALPISVRGAILEVNGVLYASAPDNAWAVDARTGAVLWHYYWKTKGGTHTSNKGLGIYGDWLYLETADDYLVSLDARTGKERWHKEIAGFAEQYFSEAAPMVIGDHVLVGAGNDADEPGTLRSLDPATGELQWLFHTTPMNAGDPGLDTWPSLDAARHGGGNVWTAGAFDPATRLYIFGTGNPSPAYGSSARRGDNLFTCALVALNVDTGKLAWYYQTSPHDTHDWDSSQTPILVDGEFNGKPRKLVLQATRNGHFFVLDRVTGEHLLTTRFTPWGKWVRRINQRGQPERDPGRDVTVGGTVLSIDGWTNWPPPAFSPQTGFFYSAGVRELRAPLLHGDGSSRGHGVGRRHPGRPGIARELYPCDRLPDRENRLGASLRIGAGISQHPRDGSTGNRRRCAVRRGPGQEFRRLRL